MYQRKKKKKRKQRWLTKKLEKVKNCSVKKKNSYKKIRVYILPGRYVILYYIYLHIVGTS